MAQAVQKLLKEEFAVQEVIVFGSILAHDRFHERSDVDLAVWGLEDGSALAARLRAELAELGCVVQRTTHLADCYEAFTDEITAFCEFLDDLAP